jgi:hypothetical protein
MDYWYQGLAKIQKSDRKVNDILVLEHDNGEIEVTILGQSKNAEKNVSEYLTDKGVCTAIKIRTFKQREVGAVPEIRDLTMGQLVAYSVKSCCFLYETIGLTRMILLSYSLEGLLHSKKTVFGYALRGRDGKSGLLKIFNGKTVGRNSVIIPFSKMKEMLEFLAYWGVSYSTDEVFIREGASNAKKK